MRAQTDTPPRGVAAMAKAPQCVRSEAVYTVTGPYTCVQAPLRMGIAALDRIRWHGGMVGPVLICHPHHVVHILTPPGTEAVWDGVPAVVAVTGGTNDCGRHWGLRYWIVPPEADEYRVDAETLRAALTDPRLWGEGSRQQTTDCGGSHRRLHPAATGAEVEPCSILSRRPM